MQSDRKCPVKWKFLRLVKEEEKGNFISLAKNGRDIFVGTSDGRILKFKIKKLFQKQEVSMQCADTLEVRVGNGEVTQILAEPNRSNFLIVLCRGVITLHSQKDLSLIHTLPKYEANMMCFSDSLTSRGLCIATKRRLILYDLDKINSVLCAKAINLTSEETVLSVRWIQNHICIGYPNEYSMVNIQDATEKIFCQAQCTSVEQLPTDEFALILNLNVVFVSSKATQTRDRISTQWAPFSITACYPFLFCLCLEGVEIKNMLDLNYSHVPKGIPTEGIKMIIVEGRDVMAISSNLLFFLAPSPLDYTISNPDSYFSTLSNLNYKSIFHYFNSVVLQDPKNPFSLLLTEYTDIFLKKFYIQESALIDKVKGFLSISLKKLVKTIRQQFGEFKPKVLEEPLYFALQKTYFSKIYYSLFSIIKGKYQTQDNTTDLYSKESYTLPELGVKKQFWLTEESIPENLATSENPKIPESQDNTSKYSVEEVSRALLDSTIPVHTLCHMFDSIPSKETNLKNSFGQTLLYMICRLGKVDILKHIILRDTLTLEGIQNDNNKTTPLHAASFCGHVEIVAMLLTVGAKPEAFGVSEPIYPYQEVNTELDQEVVKKVQQLWNDYQKNGTESLLDYLPQDWFPCCPLVASSPNSLVTNKDPYSEAISIIKKLPSKKVPSEKLKCIKKSIQACMGAIKTFWNPKSSPELGTQSLLPVFLYVILKAQIPNLYSEKNFIQSLAITQDMEKESGFGYCFTLFHLSTEIILNLKSYLDKNSLPKLDQIKANNQAVKPEEPLNKSKTSLSPEQPSEIPPAPEPEKEVKTRMSALKSTLAFFKRPSSKKNSSPLKETPVPAPVIDSKTSTMNAIIKQRNAFYEFLAKEKSEAYLLCLEAIIEFKKNPTKQQADTILSTYISEGDSTYKVYLPPKIKQNITNAVNSGDLKPTTFNSVYDEIMDVFELDCLPRFAKK